MLRFDGLTIRAGTRALVAGLSLEIEVGRIACLIGPSGCGETSVLKWLAGILPPGLEAKGTITLDGAPIPRPYPSRKATPPFLG